MARKFLTVEEALDYMNALSDDEIDEPEVIIIPPEPDLVSDEEEIDDSFTNCHTPALNDKSDLQDAAGTVEIFTKNKCDASIFEMKDVKWKKCEPKFDLSSKSIPFQEHQNITDIVSGKNPIELFHMMAEDMIAHTVGETNRYASQKNDHSFSISEGEFKLFLGVMFYSGYHILPREKMYWENAPDIGTTLVSNAISRKKYSDIKHYLHFNDNSTIDKQDRYYKIRPLFEKLNVALQQFGVFSENLTIDERMVRYFGKHGCKMFMKNKPVKFGYKLWMLASYDGYPFNIIPYQGAHEKCNEPLSQRVVENLLSVVKNPAFHKVYMDNFFTSHGLLVRLKQREFCATGTVRVNRMAKCPLKSVKDLSKTERGTSDAAFDAANKIAAVRWNDNRVVSLMSNFEDTKVKNKVDRRIKGGRKEVDVPYCVTTYNKYKNGVDLFDSHAEVYFASIQGKKWYWPLFLNCFETALVAAWKVFKLFCPSEAQDILTFRRSVTISYLGESIPRNKIRQRSLLQNNKELLHLNNEHILVKNADGRQRRCQLKNCKRKPTTICQKCNVGLCLVCFPKFHL
ncbi:piggyBac transposable element-derived protein 3-like [Uloborus diversus]|uniref:piggyBac transposable element-derived protein 3-like n=1 Tax=Uloborus diversus TaxID=327109 RepID=UPI002409B6D2|nr:piggyBac transposable element-derived protein 3-like [Uloborus diversus]